jgi:hypothetical protein
MKDTKGGTENGRGTYLSTTTMGDSELVTRPSPFHIISPEVMTDAKLRTWRRI